MYTLVEIRTAFDEQAGDIASLAQTGEVIRWFNEGQARLGWYMRGVEDVTWAVGASVVPVSTQMQGIDHILYPDGYTDQRWIETVQGIHITDYEGATAAGSARLILRVYWPDVDDTHPSLLPRLGDSACISYAMYRFYRKLVSNRSFFQRYSTLVGTNRVDIAELSDTADDHYRDFNDLRLELPTEPAALFFG